MFNAAIKSALSAGLLGSLVLLAACSGSDGAAINAAPAPSASGASEGNASGASANGANGANGSASPDGGAPSASSSSSSGGADAGADAANTVPPIAKHCSTAPASTLELCVENAQGKVGDVIDVDVYVLGTAGCTEAQEAGGRIEINPTQFELQNALDVQNCRTRRFDKGLSGNDELMWNAFGANVVPGCTANLPSGMHDTVKLKILPGTPPGDYTFKWTTSGVIGADATCSAFDSAMSGTIRVLP